MGVPPQKKPVSSEPAKEPSLGRYRTLSDPVTLGKFAQNLGEGIYITTETGEILDANPAFLRMFGVATLDDLKRYRVHDFVDAEVRRREIALMEREGSLRSRELQISRTDGAVRTVLDTWYSCKDPLSGETLFHGILVDITDRKELEIKLLEQSVRDPLTGCYNRRYLTQMFEAASGDEASWGCIYVDLDRFKDYNDRHGHSAGDAMLVRMGRFLMRHVRAEEPVIRMGGDEFVIVCGNTTLQDVELVAHRLEAEAPASAPVSFTLGWAARQENETLEETLNRADRELIKVKVVRRPETNTRRTASNRRTAKPRGT